MAVRACVYGVPSDNQERPFHRTSSVLVDLYPEQIGVGGRARDVHGVVCVGVDEHNKPLQGVRGQRPGGGPAALTVLNNMFYSPDVALLAVTASAGPSVTEKGGTVIYTVPHSMIRNFALAYSSALLSGLIRDPVVEVYDAAPGITDGPHTFAYTIVSTACGVDPVAVVDGTPLLVALYAAPTSLARSLVVSAEVSRLSS